MGSKTRLSSYCIKRANNGVNLVTSRKTNTRLARPIFPLRKFSHWPNFSYDFPADPPIRPAMGCQSKVRCLVQVGPERDAGWILTGTEAQPSMPHHDLCVTSRHSRVCTKSVTTQTATWKHTSHEKLLFIVVCYIQYMIFSLSIGYQNAGKT